MAKTPIKPAAKVGPKKTGIALKSNMQLPADFKDRKAANIAAFKSRLAVADSSKIAVTQDKKFKLPSQAGDTIKVDTVCGIIIDFAAHKRFYETSFDKDNPVPPNCYAVGFQAHDSLIPADTSPEAQSELCKGCERNKFTQNAAGKWLPKDCKDHYTLALLAPDDNGDGKLMTLNISSTGIKAFDKYVRDLANEGKALYEVLTEFSFDPKSDYASVRCAFVEDIPQSGLGLIVSVQEEAMRLVSQEPVIDGFEEKVVAKRLPAPKGKAASRKAA